MRPYKKLNVESETAYSPPLTSIMPLKLSLLESIDNYSKSTFINSNISAKEWGVLSADGCSNVVLTAVDLTIELTGDSGYGTYAIGDAKEYFYGSTFNVATSANIITGGYVTYA